MVGFLFHRTIVIELSKGLIANGKHDFFVARKNTLCHYITLPLQLLTSSKAVSKVTAISDFYYVRTSSKLQLMTNSDRTGKETFYDRQDTNGTKPTE